MKKSIFLLLVVIALAGCADYAYSPIGSGFDSNTGFDGGFGNRDDGY